MENLDNTELLMTLTQDQLAAHINNADIEKLYPDAIKPPVFNVFDNDVDFMYPIRLKPYSIKPAF